MKVEAMTMAITAPLTPELYLEAQNPVMKFAQLVVLIWLHCGIIGSHAI
jgi:hypothetical protein